MNTLKNPSFSTESIQSFHWYESFWIGFKMKRFNESFHLFPSSWLQVMTSSSSLATSATLHKIVNQILSSVILSSFMVSFPQSWHTHPPPGWWCWAESWSFSSELYSLDQGSPKVLDAEGHFSDTVRAWGPQGTMRAPKSRKLSCLAYKYTAKLIYFINYLNKILLFINPLAVKLEVFRNQLI